MTLREMLARHARGPLTRGDHFGEDVTYVFQDGSTRTFAAVVDRLDSEPVPGTTRVARLTAVVFVPRHDTEGVETVDPRDEIQLAMRLGGVVETAGIRRIVAQDEGGFTLEVST